VPRLSFTATAHASLTEILEFIAGHNPTAALALVDEIEERLTRLLETFPDSGTVYRGDLRFVTLRGYTAIYQHDAAAQTIIVLDIFGPGEDWRKA
jgi:plasmid stabilization system protein ParE